MRLLKISLFIMILSVLAAFSYAIQLDGFNYNSAADVNTTWTVIGDDLSMGGALTIARETSIKQEGTSSLKFVYAHSGNQWYEAGVHKAFSPAWNMANAKKFKIWMYNTETTVSAQNLMWYILLWTDSGAVLECDNTAAFSYLGWHQFTFDITNFAEGVWWDQATWTSPNLSSVTACEILVQQSGTAVGTTTFYLDDLEYWNSSNLSIETAALTFNYASQGALTTAWNPVSGNGGTLAISQSTVNYSGNKSLDMYCQFTAYWWNMGPVYTIPTTNFSNISYFKVWLYGDPAANNAANPLFMVDLKDAAGSDAFARVNMSGLTTAAWKEYFMPLTLGPTDYSAGPFWIDQWANSGTPLNLTAIKQIILNSQTGAAGSVSYHTYIDEIIFGSATTIPFVCDHASINARPNASAIPLNIISGVGPFTWAIDPGLGTLSATSGTSVNYTPASVATTGNIYIYDATGETLVIPVALVPTSAPLASDVHFNIITSRDIRNDWSLFE